MGFIYLFSVVVVVNFRLLTIQVGSILVYYYFYRAGKYGCLDPWLLIPDLDFLQFWALRVSTSRRICWGSFRVTLIGRKF